MHDYLSASVGEITQISWVSLLQLRAHFCSRTLVWVPTSHEISFQELANEESCIPGDGGREDNECHYGGDMRMRLVWLI